MLAAVVPAVAEPAQAAPGDPFDTSRPTVFVAQSSGGEGTTLYRAESDGEGTVSFTPEGGAADGNYNAIGFNEEDGYLYGVTTSAIGGIPVRAFVRIGESGEVTRIGNYQFPVTQFTGAINPDDGLFYSIAWTHVNPTLYVLNPSTGALVDAIDIGGTNWGIADFEYQDGYFWGVNSNDTRPAGTLMRINASNGQVAFFPEVIPDAATGSWGAAWRFGNGDLGFSNNGTGDIAQIRIANAGSASPDFDVVRVFTGPPSGNNDGAAIPGAPVDLSIVKDGPVTFRPGGTISYTLTITNESEGESSGWFVEDTVPAQLSDVSVTGDGVCADVVDNQVDCSGGRLAAGETAEIVITGTVDAGELGCFTNTAAVLGNEFDPETDNNESSFETCAQLLEISKDSNATDDARVGDEITYTVSATNIGATDYTEDAPAFVFDDLSGVLDDAEYNDDVTATLPGDLSYDEPLVSWSGALPVGETVELEYTVTLVAGGDGTVRNVAWEPFDSTTTEPPSCDPVTDDGRDAVTGEPCAANEFLLPKLSIQKTADRTSLPAVGEVVEYTIVVTNEGPGTFTTDEPATFVDDLSGVLDDATFNDDAIATVGDVSLDETELAWSGVLAADESATVTYSVTYTGAGDQLVTNLVCVPESETAAGAESCATVEVPGAGLSQWKEATASSDPLLAGSTITYTLFFDNDGQAEAEIDAIDDLTHVLDDAEVTVEPVSADGLTVDRDGAQIAVSGLVPAGEQYTVTYTVTVLPDGERGDSVATNFLLAPGETPPEDGVCVPAEGEDAECTSNPITGVSYAKSVEASETPVREGTELAYTVTVVNTGATTVDVSRDDVLDGVLDDATLTGAPESDTATVTVSGPSEGLLEIRGTLAAGATAQITYTATVSPQSERGDSIAANFLVPPGEEPGDTCDPADAQCTFTPIQGYTVSKVADVDVAAPGDVVTYTVEVVNTGAIEFTEDAPVTFTDDLSAVLDDATYNDDVTAGGSVVGETLTWSGPLDIGADVTVTYSVTVNDPATGDGVLTNAVVPSTPGGDCAGECTTETLLSSYTVEKAASTTTVMPGDTVTYTVTVTNTGTADYTADAPASFVDDLSGVLDDATYNGDATEGATITDGTLAWSGALAAEESVSIEYSVTVNDPISGDQNLVNAVVPNGPGGTCASDGDCMTETAVASFTVSKDADVSMAMPGDVVTYNVTVTNTGDVDYTEDAPASFADDLSGVLDDAVYNDDATNGASVTGSTLTWSGALAVDEIVTVSYSVTLDDPITGDFELLNVVTPTGPGGQCDGECSTQTPVGSFHVQKTTDATEVVPGDVVEYTITVTNTGQLAYPEDAPASFTDDMSGVLDDATYNADAASSAGDVEVVDGVLSWSGPLALADVVTVTYSITVNDPATGDRQLDNAVVTPPGTGGNCAEGSFDPDCVSNVPAGTFSIAKSTDAETVLPGDVVTYTVTVTNTGQRDYTADEPASFVDDLSRVLDDAAYNGDVSEGGAVVDDTLIWAGPLAVGESVDVTYSVTVADPVSGDFALRNVVAPSAPGGECVADECVTETQVASYTVVKSADEADVALGGTVAYSVTVTNIGQVPYTESQPASFSDDLSEVLDDAVYNDDATAGAVVDGERLSWAGSLDIGESVTITYSVTVNQPATGDGVLVNTVTADGPGGGCAADGDCVVETPIAAYMVTKTASTSNATVGDTIGYTVTVENTGQVDFTDERPASFTDDLSEALALGSYNGDATQGATFESPVLSWSGALAMGETVTVTYSVTVDQVGAIENVVVTPDGSGGNCIAALEAPECQTLTQVVPPLAVTGGQLWAVGGIAGAVLIGLGVWLAVRRREALVTS